MHRAPIQLSLLASILTFVASPAAADSYHVRFSEGRSDDGAMRQADVTAVLTPQKGRFGLLRAGADTGLYHQWAGFVLSIEAADSAGRPLDLVYHPHGQWQARGWRSGEITVRYAMALQHDRFPNEPGDDELANATPYGVMWTGRALFMEGAPSTAIDVTFEAPDGWRVTAPWNATDASALHFTAADTNDLLDSAFFAGRHVETTVDAAGVSARIATGPDMGPAASLYADTLTTYLSAYAELLNTPAGASPVIIGAPAGFWGGGVMGRTISLSHGGEIDDNIAPMVRYIVAHEVFHLWNASWRYEDRTRALFEWLSEGAAEYYTLLTQLRVGDFPAEEAFLAQAAGRWTQYRNSLDTVSIADAGRTKLETGDSYSLVYNGGFSALMTLDLMIRTETRNAYSLKDVIRELHTNFGSAGTARLTPSHFIRSVKKATGVDIRPFVRNHISAPQPLPLGQALSAAGVCLSETSTEEGWTAEFAICQDETAEQRAFRASWFSGN